MSWVIGPAFQWEWKRIWVLAWQMLKLLSPLCGRNERPPRFVWLRSLHVLGGPLLWALPTLLLFPVIAAAWERKELTRCPQRITIVHTPLERWGRITPFSNFNMELRDQGSVNWSQHGPNSQVCYTVLKDLHCLSVRFQVLLEVFIYWNLYPSFPLQGAALKATNDTIQTRIWPLRLEMGWRVTYLFPY